ncbi:MAG: AMP-binding protein [Propionibacteriaceae bacterium]|jgi:long-chain acyl-CoA synthetase|nr:AMP-binding protein [Propionibacteriaceae bacterium]
MTLLDERPWTRFYPDISEAVDVPDKTMYELLANTAATYPDKTALVYLGRRISFKALLREIDRCAAALAGQGLRAGDSVLLSMPNVPNTIILFYAVNRLGARAVMTHPLSSPTELRHYLNTANARWAVTLDMFYWRLAEILPDTLCEKVLIAKVSDYLTNPKKIGFQVTKGRKVNPVPHDDPKLIRWRDLMRGAKPASGYERAIQPADGAVVLFSGGTTDMPKGIELSSAAFNALAVSMQAITGLTQGHTVLTILPVFHGFGLGLCVHTTLTAGACPILVPEFSARIYIDNLLKYQPSFIAGVPTLFQALLAHPKFKKVDFSKLQGAYSGGDSLTPDLKHRFDTAIKELGGQVEVLEGYGLTECVTACALSPAAHYRENAVGVPIPGILMKIADPVSGAPLPPGADGEICVTGPTLMNGYVNDPEATAQTLRRHDDGLTWLHTGDIGMMDEDGYLYFRGRQKRIIKVSGVSVYPAQIEQVLEASPLVRRACAIGTPDEYQMASVKAFIILADGVAADDTTADELRKHCAKHLIKWAVPRAFAFRDELPTTLVGKVAYTELEKEEQPQSE